MFKNYINKKIKLIVIVYEGQPFQNNLISYLKVNTTIKTVGYIHSPPLAFPSNFIKKKFSPSKIVLNAGDMLGFITGGAADVDVVVNYLDQTL